MFYYSRMKYYKILMLPSRKSVLGYLWTISLLKCLKSKHRFLSNHSAPRKVGQMQAMDNAAVRLEKCVQSLSASTPNAQKSSKHLPSLLQSFFVPDMHRLGYSGPLPKNLSKYHRKGACPKTHNSFQF